MSIRFEINIELIFLLSVDCGKKYDNLDIILSY